MDAKHELRDLAFTGLPEELGVVKERIAGRAVVRCSGEGEGLPVEVEIIGRPREAREVVYACPNCGDEVHGPLTLTPRGET